MSNLPNPSVALVGPDGRPSTPLLGLMPTLSAIDVVADRQGLPTPLFLKRVSEASRETLSARAQIVNRDGTPTRLFTNLLARLP